ncbi:MAG: hypothetical protein HRT68_06765 [Flavobacteriaceae bacterium]|nr:hypothetical protein [Flavobacteriaceae bacterium]
MTRITFLIAFLSAVVIGNAQTYPKMAVNLGVGFNLSQTPFSEGYSAKPINFPTIELGAQYLFTKQIGARLDYGFNRFSNDSNAPEFKTNYNRIDVQAVYNASVILRNWNVHPRLGLYFHGGGGMTFLNPLAPQFNGNNESFLNAMGGMSIHYGLSEYMSAYMDISYIRGFGGSIAMEGTPLQEKEGNGIVALTFGIQLALNTACYFCEGEDQQ